MARYGTIKNEGFMSMRFEQLTTGNYMMYALLHYDNPHCKDIQEFFEDVKRLHYIRRLFKRYKDVFNNFPEIRIFSEPKGSKSNYWLQTLILDHKNISSKNKLIKAAHNSKIFMRPAWKLISELGPYKKKQMMNLEGAREIYNRVINLPSSQSLIGKIK